MTATVLHAVSPSALSRLFVRLGKEIVAFFEEAGRAINRAQREEPFGL